jgi:hypothetical protein
MESRGRPGAAGTDLGDVEADVAQAGGKKQL